MASEATKGDRTEKSALEHPSTQSDIDTLRSDFESLADRTQRLLTEKLLLENEVNQLSKRANRLEEDLRHLKTPPLVVGSVQDVVGDRAIVKSSNGTVFLVTYNPRIDSTLLIPGARVTLNQDSLSIIEMLP